jgi:hypothetical protein
MPASDPTSPGDGCSPQNGVVDLTSKMSPDGRLTWDIPPGKWTILRFVRTTTGQVTRPAPAPGLGFETDKFDAAAQDAHFEQFIGRLLMEIGPRKKGPGGLSTLHFDSWEMSSQNWSGKFREEFQKRRGYDPLPVHGELLVRQLSGDQPDHGNGVPSGNWQSWPKAVEKLRFSPREYLHVGPDARARR